MNGTLSILNVGSGDTKLSFDKSNPAECIRAGRIVTDMLRRGYALLVEVERNGERAYERVQAFDPDTSEYIIADFDPLAADPDSMETTPNGSEAQAAQEGATPEAEPPRRKRGRPRRVSAEGANAVAVARSAGG